MKLKCIPSVGVFVLTVMTLVASRSSVSFVAVDSPAKMELYVETIPGTDLKFEMVPIPAGVFTMGSSSSEPKRG